MTIWYRGVYSGSTPSISAIEVLEERTKTVVTPDGRLHKVTDRAAIFPSYRQAARFLVEKAEKDMAYLEARLAGVTQKRDYALALACAAPGDRILTEDERTVMLTGKSRDTGVMP